MARPTKQQAQARLASQYAPLAPDATEEALDTGATVDLSVHDVEPLLTPDEVSAWLRKPKTTLDQWRHRATGPASFKVGNDVRYSRSDVQAWLNANARRGAA